MNNEIITLGENKNEFIINQEFLNAVIEIEKKAKELKKAQEEYKSRLLNEMEEKGISISYIESKNNEEVFHKNEFREKYPDIYDEFITLDGKKKAYLTIRVNND